jgi:hypothetical protein
VSVPGGPEGAAPPTATFVLLPGVGRDSWYWHLVAPRLRARGMRSSPRTCRPPTTPPGSASTRKAGERDRRSRRRDRRGAVPGGLNGAAAVRPGRCPAARPRGADDPGAGRVARAWWSNSGPPARRDSRSVVATTNCALRARAAAVAQRHRRRRDRDALRGGVLWDAPANAGDLGYRAGGHLRARPGEDARGGPRGAQHTLAGRLPPTLQHKLQRTRHPSPFDGVIGSWRTVAAV